MAKISKSIIVATMLIMGNMVYADPVDTRLDTVVKVAAAAINEYALVRIGGLLQAFQPAAPLNQGQICGLMGMAEIGFQVLSATGITDQQIAAMLKPTADLGISMDLIQSTLKSDSVDCGPSK